MKIDTSRISSDQAYIIMIQNYMRLNKVDSGEDIFEEIIFVFERLYLIFFEALHLYKFVFEKFYVVVFFFDQVYLTLSLWTMS